MYVVGNTTIEIIRSWNMCDVREVCRKYKLYSRGTNNDYNKMLLYVSENKPSVPIIYRTAKDIYAHSNREDFDIELIMCILTRIVKTEYKLTTLW